jgi:hypothetical protein
VDQEYPPAIKVGFPGRVEALPGKVQVAADREEELSAVACNCQSEVQKSGAAHWLFAGATAQRLELSHTPADKSPSPTRVLPYRPIHGCLFWV